MSERGLDPWLDARLRNVSVPDDLAQRLHQITAWTDEHLDAALRDVPVDDGLRQRLHDTIHDIELDGQIREVEIPKRIGKRLRRIATARRDRWLGVALASAAALFLTVGLPLLRQTQKPDSEQVTNTPSRSVVVDDPSQANDTAIANNRVADPLPLPLDPSPTASESTNSLPPSQLVLDAPESQAIGDAPISSDVPFHVGARPSDEDESPKLESIPALVHRGIAIPSATAFDRRFLFQHNLNPIVTIGQNRALHAVAIPPWTSDVGFLHNQDEVRAGRLPHPRDVHVEDFLAAVDFRLPEVSTGRLGIRVAAGPSQFGNSADAQMILVGVAAGPSTNELTKVVGRRVSMKIAFNPQVVQAYRVIGHEPEAVGMVSAPVECVLSAGQAALGMLEVWLRPNEENLVATVEVNWSDASDVPQMPVSQPITRLQFATSMEEMPMALQFATIVSQTAEVLRGSYYAGKSKSLSHVLDFAQRVNPQLAKRIAFQRFVTFVEQSDVLLGDRSSEVQ